MKKQTAPKYFLTASGKALVFLLALFGFGAKAQDIHFTQFFSNPLLLNPSQTGFYNGNYRVGFNFKAQWPWASDAVLYNYHTETPYVDFSIGEGKLKTGWMGVGVSFLNDEAGDGRLTFRRIGLSYAYHQPFDKEKRYVLSAGASVHYSARSIDYSKFYFNNQWVDDYGFDLSISSNEPLSNERFSYFDIAAGIHMSAKVSEKLKLYGGGCILHVNRPQNTFYGNDSRLGFRYQANSGADIILADYWTWSLHAYYGLEERASELLIGSLVERDLPQANRTKSEHAIYVGVYYRVNDAIAPIVGYRYKQTRLLLNYDFTVSRLIKSGKANGGPELSLVHVGRWSSDNRSKINCPKF